MSMLNSKQRWFLICLAFIIVSCKSDVPDKRQVDSINIRLLKDPQKINPIFNPHSVAREIYQYLYLPLADFHPISKELTPILIEKLPIEEKITSGPYEGDVLFDFNIKKDATWTDGSSITASDYAFTIKSILLPNSATGGWKTLLSKIKDVEIDPNDDKHVRVVVDGDYMLAREIVLTIFMLPEQMHDKDGVLSKYSIADIKEDDGRMEDLEAVKAFANYFNSPVISRDSVHNNGPYKLVNWVTNQSLVLQKKRIIGVLIQIFRSYKQVVRN